MLARATRGSTARWRGRRVRPDLRRDLPRHRAQDHPAATRSRSRCRRSSPSWTRRRHRPAGRAAAGHGLDGTGQRAPRAAACADIYTRCVNTGRPVSGGGDGRLPVGASRSPRSWPRCSAPTRPRKRARNLLDFDDLLPALAGGAGRTRPPGRCCAACSTRSWWTSTRTSNAVQASIVRLLQPDGKQLTCVGDDAQAIYGFRGADRRTCGSSPRLPGARHRAAGPQLPVPAGHSRPGQRHPPVSPGPGPETVRRPRPGDDPLTRPLPRRGPPRRGRSAPGCRGCNEDGAPAWRDQAGACRRSPQHPAQISRAWVASSWQRTSSGVIPGRGRRQSQVQAGEDGRMTLARPRMPCRDR